MPKASRVSVGRTLSRSIFFWKLMIGSSIMLSWISVGGITMLQSMKSAMALVTSFSVWARKASRQKTCQSTNTEGIYAPIKAEGSALLDLLSHPVGHQSTHGTPGFPVVQITLGGAHQDYDKTDGDGNLQGRFHHHRVGKPHKRNHRFLQEVQDT